jgi:hypothetical protein
MSNQASLQTGQNRMPNNMGSSSNQFYGISPANNIRGKFKLHFKFLVLLIVKLFG